jgi:hypothetical protein
MDIGRNIAGQRESTKFAVESCRWIMHNANVAMYDDKVWGQRSAILLLITTLITANAFGWVYYGYFMDMIGINEETATRGAFSKIIMNILWALLTFVIVVPSEPNSYVVLLVILFPPLLLLGLYEFFLTDYVWLNKPFVHPYFFTTVLASLTFLAHIEMGVQDYDIIMFELIKCNVIGYVYMQIIWKHMITKSESDASASPFTEEGTLRTVLLVVVMQVFSLMAPYPMQNEYVLLWYLPCMWTILCIGSVVWISSYNFNEYFGSNVPPVKKYTDNDMSPASVHTSMLVIFFSFLLTLYYLREHSTVYRVLIDNFPEQSIQYNVSNTWQRAPTIVPYL